VRSDVDREIPALANHVVRQELAMAVAREGVSVATIEHLLAALAGAGIDNARIVVSGSEVPVFDGSARQFLHLIDEAGRKELAAPRNVLVVHKAVEVEAPAGLGAERRFARIEPLGSSSSPSWVSRANLEIEYEIDFKHPRVGRQTFSLAVTEESFRAELAPARTFCFLKDVEAMRSRGLALGGSLENAVVLTEDGFLNAPRMKDEFVRHKALDAVGDLALAGFPVRGRFIARCAGHALHAQLVQALLKDHSAWSLERSAPADPLGFLSERYAATA
jgi:UDP-3-O-[3-hydroxymyristoyl] N-acetylglucosamine deacetylase